MNELIFLIKDNTTQVYEAKVSFYAMSQILVFYQVDSVRALGLRSRGFEIGAILDPYILFDPYVEAVEQFKRQMLAMFPNVELKAFKSNQGVK